MATRSMSSAESSSNRCAAPDLLQGLGPEPKASRKLLQDCAEVAQTDYTAFSSRSEAQQMPAGYQRG
jgi:hypothetical protein